MLNGLKAATPLSALNSVRDFSASGHDSGELQKSIEEFMLVVASWVIRARWQEIRRFIIRIQSQLILSEFTYLIPSL